MKNNLSDCLAIIPARYASTRFPGKPLAKLGGKYMLERVVRQVEKSGIETIVATDDERIEETMRSLGIQVVMTGSHHKSGTDRIAEAAQKINSDASIIVNVQGDEPFIRPEQIEALVRVFDQEEIQIATLAKKFDPSLGIEVLKDANLVKLTFDDYGKALYFSRSVIPYMRGMREIEWAKHHQYFTHIGMYAYRRTTLSALTALPQSSLEKAESLEQLRWLQCGFTIGVSVTPYDTIGIDTSEDLRNAEEYLKIHSDIFE